MLKFMAPARWICWIDLEELKKTVEALRLSDDDAIFRSAQDPTSPRRGFITVFNDIDIYILYNNV